MIGSCPFLGHVVPFPDSPENVRLSRLGYVRIISHTLSNAANPRRSHTLYLALALKARRLRTVALLLGITGQRAKSVLAQSAPGQHVLVVRVVDDATHLPLVNAEVIVTGTQQTSFTNDNGEARLLRTSDGPLSLRVRQIGFQFSERNIASASTGSADTVVVSLQPVSYKLPKVATRAVNSCGAATDSLSQNLSAVVLSQLRLSAERYDAFRRAYPFNVWIERRTARRDADGTIRTEPVQVPGTQSDKWGDPYVPGRVLSEQPGGGFSVPILFVSALADANFWKHHCFVARGVQTFEGARVIQLDFMPTKETKTPDWEGSALVDSATSMLRRVDFDLTGLGKHDVLKGLVGYTMFRSPTAFITMPDSTMAMWWTSAPLKDGTLRPADGYQLIRVLRIAYRKATPVGVEPLPRDHP